LPEAINLMPNGNQEITISFQPPHRTDSYAQEYPVTIYATSLNNPEERASAECTLTVEPYGQVQSQLRPEEGRSGQPMRVELNNESNLQQTVRLTWSDSGELLDFEPERGTAIQLQPGASETVHFVPTVRQRPWFGGQKNHSIAVSVTQSGRQGSQDLNGIVHSRGLVPGWVPPLLLGSLAVIVAGLVFGLGRFPQAPTVLSTPTPLVQEPIVAEPSLAIPAAPTPDVQVTQAAQQTANAQAVALAAQQTADAQSALPAQQTADTQQTATAQSALAAQQTADAQQTASAQQTTNARSALSAQQTAESKSVVAAQQTADAGCEILPDQLDLRSGPGNTYDPPINVLPAGTKVQVLSFIPHGFPSGQWAEVRVRDTGQQGWMNLASLGCTVNMATVPIGVIPPTPTVDVRPTLTLIAQQTVATGSTATVIAAVTATAVEIEARATALEQERRATAAIAAAATATAAEVQARATALEAERQAAAVAEKTRIAQSNRLWSISGVMKMRDDETFGGDERGEHTVSDRRFLTSSQNLQVYDIQGCTGGEVRGEIHIQLSLQAGGVIQALVRLRYYEGTSCGTNDLERTFEEVYSIRPNQPTNVQIKLSDGDGDVDFQFTMSNTNG